MDTALEFLQAHLPASDLDCYPAGLFQQFADHARMLRETAPWCAALDEELFHHYVLFPRVNDEDLSFHRRVFYDALWPRVRDLPTTEGRILEVNRWCHEHASYQAQDERTASPLTVYRCGSGRCGEESAFLVSALRSVGIPARQVYAPWWSHCDDNHAWVEALCGDQWRFLGACEPEPVLDRGWFHTAASRAMLIHSRIFGVGSSPVHGAFLSRDGAVCWYNQTSRYASTRPYTFRALKGGKPAAGATFRLQVLNGASFQTIAVLAADENGEAHAELGKGDLYVTASLDGFRAEGFCADGEITLQLAPPLDATPWVDFTFRAPAGREAPPASLDAVQKASRAETLRRGNELRTARINSFFQPEKEGWDGLLRAARGNYGEIRRFLSGGNAPDREHLLHTLADKDLRDTPSAVLEDHFTHLPPRLSDIPDEIYWKYTACPRIALEKLTSWRGSLLRWLEGWKGSPAALWHWLKDLLVDQEENLYSNLYWPPDTIPEAGGCDEKSRRVLFIASLRAMGVPARLRPLDGAPEIWRDGAFQTVFPEDTGLLILACPSGVQPLNGLNWSLSRRTADSWQRLHPADSWTDGTLHLSLPAGYYRLITSARMPNGNQYAAMRDFSVQAHEEHTLELRMRACALSDMLYRREMPPLPAQTLDGTPIPDLLHTDSRPKLIFWLEEGSEPTEHILNELLDRQPALENLPIGVVFLLRGRGALSQQTLSAVLARWPSIQVLFDDWAYDLESAARLLALDPDAPPLAVVCDGSGYAVYGGCGYRVGAVDLLARVAAHLCAQ